MFSCLMFLNIYYWKKLTFSKLVEKVNLSKRKFEEIHQLWRAKNTRYIWENVYFGIFIFRCCSSTKLSQISFKLFFLEIKGFHQSSLENEVDFRDLMRVSPNFLAKNQNFKKLRQLFLDERALITTTLVSSCHWKTLVPFCLQKKRPENAFLTLIVNYRKIVQKNKLCHSKQQ